MGNAKRILQRVRHRELYRHVNEVRGAPCQRYGGRVPAAQAASRLRAGRCRLLCAHACACGATATSLFGALACGPARARSSWCRASSTRTLCRPRRKTFAACGRATGRCSWTPARCALRAWRQAGPWPLTSRAWAWCGPASALRESPPCAPALCHTTPLQVVVNLNRLNWAMKDKNPVDNVSSMSADDPVPWAQSRFVRAAV